ncbi:beta propeller repeat protein [Siphonobacter curvatus]|uniref:Glycosyl hydrolase n=1 Tax=Siphonobacter curvatus TaxID=2094562 RepID=A0A2S7ITA9_9BACT|nr:glycosyl hydrolase [Siphonobacter curvatus]PQA60912.1 glycosyl hydrolase [Siphonobacter curvatus]
MSFIVWEVAHVLKLNRRKKYLAFSSRTPHTVIEEGIIQRTSDPESLLHELEETSADWLFCLITPSLEYWCVSQREKHQLYHKTAGATQAKVVSTFDEEIKSLYITQANVILIASGGCIFRSNNQGISFQRVLQLSSPISWFLFNNGIAELPSGELFIGEYGSIWQQTRWQSLAYFYHSKDQGLTWQQIRSLHERGVNKHVHVLKYSTLLQSLIMTDGDNHKKLWINSSLSCYDQLNRFKRNQGWKMVTHLHLFKGGYTSMLDGSKRMFLGSDYMGGTNFLVSTTDGKRYQSLIIPDPYRRCPIMNMTYLKTATHTEIWASLFCGIGRSTKCLIMYTDDDGLNWHKFLEYDGSRYAIHLISHTEAQTGYLYLSVTSTEWSTYRVYKIRRS